MTEAHRPVPLEGMPGSHGAGGVVSPSAISAAACCGATVGLPIAFRDKPTGA